MNPWIKLVELVAELSDDSLPPPVVEICDEDRLFVVFHDASLATYYWHDGDWQLEEGSQAEAGRAE